MARSNSKYGKLTDGTLTYAPYYLEHDGKTTVNATPEMYLGHGGWKQIKETEYPQGEDEMVQYAPVYTEDDTTIYGTWKKIIE